MSNRTPRLSDTQCFRIRNMTNIDGGIILTKIIEGHPAKDNKNEQLQPMINTISKILLANLHYKIYHL